MTGTGCGAEGTDRKRVPLGALVFSSVMAAGAACAEDAPPRFRLTVGAEAAVPDDVDGIRVSVVASRTTEGALCVPVTGTFALTGPGDLPIRVDYRPGPMYDEFVAFRAEWFKDGALVNMLEQLMPNSGGASDLGLTLTAVCLARFAGGAPCLPGEQCLGVTAYCEPSSGLGVFDNPDMIDPGAPSCETGAAAP